MPAVVVALRECRVLAHRIFERVGVIDLVALGLLLGLIELGLSVEFSAGIIKRLVFRLRLTTLAVNGKLRLAILEQLLKHLGRALLGLDHVALAITREALDFLGLIRNPVAERPHIGLFNRANLALLFLLIEPCLNAVAALLGLKLTEFGAELF